MTTLNTLSSTLPASAPTSPRRSGFAVLQTTVRVAALTCALLCAETASGAQLSSGVNSTGSQRVAVQPKGDEAGGQIGSTLAATGGLIVAEGQPRDFVGYGYNFNTDTAEWVVKKPIFTPTTPLGTDTEYEGSTFDLLNYRSASNSYSSTEVSASFSTSIGLVKAGGSYSEGETSTASSENTALGFVFKQEYAPKIVPYGQSTNYTLTQDALEVLAISNPSIRAERWREEFGSYVAVGLDIYGHLGVKVSVSNFNSTKTRSQYVSLKASYGESSGEGSMSSAAFLALASSGLDLGWEYKGDVPLSGIQLPVTASQLDEPSEQQAFVQSMYDASLGAKTVRGVILIPASSFPAAPDLDMPNWESTLFNEAALAAQLALGDLHSSQAYNFPASFRVFLADRPIVDPTGMPDASGDTYGSRLDEARRGMVASLQDLWDRTREYMESPDDPAVKAALQAQTAAVEDARTAIGQATALIEVLKHTLPPITVALTENFSAPATGCDEINRQFTWVVDNVAAFTDGSYLQRYEWLGYHNGADFSMRLLETGGCVTPNFPHFSEVLFPPTGIDEYVYTSGPQKGLKRFVFSHNAPARVSSPVFRAELLDDFARLATKEINANHQ